MSYSVVETKPSNRLKVRSYYSYENREAVYSRILVLVLVNIKELDRRFWLIKGKGSTEEFL